MTLRETAINEACLLMEIALTSGRLRILSDLIDQAEAGKLKESLPATYVGDSGILTVHPDGRREHRP